MLLPLCCLRNLFLHRSVPWLVLYGLSRMVWSTRMMLVVLDLKTICVSKLTTSTTPKNWRKDGSSNICSWLAHGLLCLQTSSLSACSYLSIWSNSTRDFSWVGMSLCMTKKKIWLCVLKPLISTKNLDKSNTSSPIRLELSHAMSWNSRNFQLARNFTELVKNQQQNNYQM